jgi:hypothetical protein
MSNQGPYDRMSPEEKLRFNDAKMLALEITADVGKMIDQRIREAGYDKSNSFTAIYAMIASELMGQTVANAARQYGDKPAALVQYCIGSVALIHSRIEYALKHKE